MEHGEESGACSALATGWPGIALPPGSSPVFRAHSEEDKKNQSQSQTLLSPLSSHSPSCPFQLGSRGWFVLVAWSPPSTNRPTPEPTDGMPAAPTCCSAMWLACRGSTLSWTPHTAALLFDRHQARRARRHALPLRHGRQGKQENSPPHAESRGQGVSPPNRKSAFEKGRESRQC